MNWKQEFSKNKVLQSNLNSFLNQYGIGGLEKALEIYSDINQEYICKTKKSVSKLKIGDILYLDISKHIITIHTTYGTYKKYGSLNRELELLGQYKFVRCSQSCIVSLDKIQTVQNNDIILINDERLHISRNYVPKVLVAFSGIPNKH